MNSVKMTAVLRADAAPAMGTGHVMRCLALAEALEELGWVCCFAAPSLPDSLARRLAESGFPLAPLDGSAGSADDAAALLRLAEQLDAGVVVVDGYHFSPAYRATVASAGRRVLVFDDLCGSGLLHADVVVNAAPAVLPSAYAQRAPSARLLLGPAYAPLRREIRRTCAAPRQPLPDRRDLFVTFGGSDPLGLTLPLLGVLPRLLPADIRVVAAIGGLHPAANACMALAAASDERIVVHRDTRSMGALMGAAGLAVSAAGTTTAELAALGVPTVLAVVADNQAVSRDAMETAGWCRVVDARQPEAVTVLAAEACGLWHDLPQRQMMAGRADTLVDGKGALRIARFLCILCK